MYRLIGNRLRVKLSRIKWIQILDLCQAKVLGCFPIDSYGEAPAFATRFFLWTQSFCIK